MTMDPNRWVGRDESLGIRSLPRPDAPRASDWSLEAIAAVEIPHDSVVTRDGQRVAFILNRDTSDVWSVSIDGGPVSRITTGRQPAPSWEDDAPAWSPDGSRLAFSQDGWLWVVDANGGRPRKVVEASSPVWIDDDSLVITVDRDSESRLARVGVEDPWAQPLTTAGMNVSFGDISRDRTTLLFVDYPKDDRNRSDVWVLDLASGESRRLAGEPAIQGRSPRISPDGSTVAYASEHSGWYEIHLVAIDGSWERQLTRAERDFSGLAWNQSGTHLLAATWRQGRGELVTVDAGSGEVSVLATGGEWASPGWAGDSAVVIHEGHASPPAVVRVDPDGSVTRLTAPPPSSVVSARHVAPEEVRYRSLDGLEIHGFLFRPEAAGSGAVPAIVYPHGGPTSSYGDLWDGHAQYFIDKGYAWFAINFRGSTGYGRDFERANHGVWGVADTEDCLAAADYLASLDWIDERRLAIFGASYGSYMALASLARDPELRYACGVAKYGDSDIATSWAQGDRGGREDLERMMGRPANDHEAYREGSPLWIADRIQRPILVAHGEQDARVHPDQSSQLVAELRRLGKTFEYVTYPTEAHGFLRTEPQVDFYRRLERFLDWHLM